MRQGVYDTVQVLFTGGNLFGGGGTGGAGSVASNHTLWTNINTFNVTGEMWKSPFDVDLVELYMHEPMHGFDGTYMNEPSISLPDGHLHGATGYKYNKGPNGWKHWLRDYWLGTVIGPDDTYSGYGNALFQLPRPREIAADKTSTTTRIFQRSSGKCLTSQSGSSWPQSNELLVFSSICDTEASKFTLQDNGVLKHEASGMCVHPLGGEAFQENIRLVFWPTCPEFDQIKLEITDDSSIRNLYSNRCVYPFGGLSNPAEGTEAVFHSGCASENIQFIFKRY